MKSPANLADKKGVYYSRKKCLLWGFQGLIIIYIFFVFNPVQRMGILVERVVWQQPWHRGLWTPYHRSCPNADAKVSIDDGVQSAKL